MRTVYARLSERATAFSQSSQYGIWIMIIAMLLFPSVDVLAKMLSKSLSPVQISFLRVACQALFVLAAARTLPRLLYPGALTARLLLCAALVNTAIIFMIWGLAFLPVANAIALFFIEPLLLMLLSALLLKEKSSALRYVLAAVGLLGAMIVIRPNWQLYGWPAVLPMCSALFFALYLLLIRTTRERISATQAQSFISLAGTAMLGTLLWLGQGTDLAVVSWHHIAASDYSLILLLGFFAALTHWMMGKAFTLNQANVLAPFRYLEIISATALGYLIFNDIPDAMTWLGTAIILGSGIMLMRLDK
ncbi:MAG: DMT family transporter [Pseudomonadales bacterium]